MLYPCNSGNRFPAARPVAIALEATAEANAPAPPLEQPRQQYRETLGHSQYSEPSD